MKAIRFVLLVGFLVIVPLVLVGCGVSSSTAVITPSAATIAATLRPTITPAPPTRTPRPTQTPRPSKPTEIIPTLTATPEPPSWLVDARLLSDWPEGYSYYIQWSDANLLEVTSHGESEYHFRYDLQTASLQLEESQPSSYECQAEVYSRKSTYYILRTDPTTDTEGRQTFHTLQLFRTHDKKLISQVGNVAIMPCSWSFGWSNSESILSFASEKPDCEESSFCYDIFVWKTDGSQPYIVGQGTYPDEPGTWSPDASRLAVEIYNQNAATPEDQYTYLIMYPDGRPLKETQGQLGTRGESGVSWLTNEIIYESNNCCVSWNFTDYFIADTGEKLTELSWRRTANSFQVTNQYPELSADQRWFILDQTNQGILDPDEPFEFIYTLYDFNTRQSFTLSKTDAILIDFVGWSGSTFYFVRRPISDAVVEAPDAPFGLIALDPTTRQMRLVNPNISFAWLGADSPHLFAVNRNEGQYAAALYSLSGEPVTQPVEITMPGPFSMPTVPELDSKWRLPDEDPIIWAWSPDRNVIAFLDGARALWLIGKDGRAQKVADYLPDTSISLYDTTGTKQPNTTSLLWSPQSEYLIISAGEDVWMVDAK